MPKKRCAIVDDYQNCALGLADWQSLAADVEFTAFTDHLDDEDAVARRLRDFEIVSIMRERTPFPRTLFAKLPNLKLLLTSGMRNAAIDVAAARDHGVMVCGTQMLGYPTAELTWGLILGLLRQIPLEDRETRAGSWQRTLGVCAHGKVLSVLGLGRLGSQVATVGKAFGMEVIAWSQNLTAEKATVAGARLVSKQELFEQADYLSIHLVLGDRTRGLVGAADLARMKPTAYLINTSRGPIVDEAALLDALRDRRIAGAGLDVYDVEPLPADHPLLALDNVLLTPHLGFVTKDAYAKFYGDTVENVAAFLRGAPIRVLNP
jgi:phosphoglycerate dehydrogenase-like enzyme